MAFEQYYAQEWKSISTTSTAETKNISGCFDCNICLDFVCDPVVTLCGHLYCWPCIYKWFHAQSAALSSYEHPTCPVCKKEISHDTLVPLYGRGHSPKETDLKGKARSLGMTIPPRPPACGTQVLTATSQSGQQLPYRNPYQNQHYEDNYSSPSSFGINNSTAMGNFHPVVAMFGEMVNARFFGNSENVYRYPNSYNLVGSGNPRLRRQEMEADKSLNRISIFFLCCILLCLLLF